MDKENKQVLNCKLRFNVAKILTICDGCLYGITSLGVWWFVFIHLFNKYGNANLSQVDQNLFYFLEMATIVLGMTIVIIWFFPKLIMATVGLILCISVIKQKIHNPIPLIVLNCMYLTISTIAVIAIIILFILAELNVI